MCSSWQSGRSPRMRPVCSLRALLSRDSAQEQRASRSVLQGSGGECEGSALGDHLEVGGRPQRAASLYCKLAIRNRRIVVLLLEVHSRAIRDERYVFVEQLDGFVVVRDRFIEVFRLVRCIALCLLLQRPRQALSTASAQPRGPAPLLRSICEAYTPPPRL